MSGTAFLSADPGRPERMKRFATAIAGWAGSETLRPAAAAHKLGVGRQFLGDVVQGRMDPLDVAPSTAMRIIQMTGYTAQYLGFEEPASEGIKPPLADARATAAASVQAVGAPAAYPQLAAGAPYVFRRPGSPIGAWYEVPGTVVLHLGTTDTRLGELTTRLSIDDCDHAIAALTQAVGAARRAKACADFHREA